ncbi:MAG: antitoxin VbhA family protein [Gordonia sp. (in: high G+C Gram-positive bacteria)]
MAASHITRTDDETIAAIVAGHDMAGMAMSADGEAAARRILRGETTADEEVVAFRARYRRTNRA